MRRTSWSLLACLALVPQVWSGCGHDSKGSSQGAGAGGPGCIQGMVVNGLTSDPVTLPSGGSGDKGLFMLVQGSLLPASPVVSDPTAIQANPLLAGEYNLCGVPVDEDFPVLVWLDGYQPFEGQVKVHSTAPSRSPLAKADLPKPYPVELVNILVYPTAQQTKDLEIVVTNNGAALAGATVLLRAVGTNFLDPSGTTFLPPRNTRFASLSGTTDAGGKVVIPAAQLVLGGHYTYTVLPPNGGQAQTAVAAAAFVLGLRAAPDTSEPYRITVDLAHSVDGLAVLSQSTDNNDPDPSGKLTFWFNREIEILPGTEDQITASLSGAVTAALADDVPANKQPDQVKVTIEGNKLTLEPVFKTKPDADTTKEPSLQVSYSGLRLRPKASPTQLDETSVSGSVRFYQ